MPALGTIGIDAVSVTDGTCTSVSYPLYDAHGNMVGTLGKGTSGSYSFAAEPIFDAWGNIPGANGTETRNHGGPRNLRSQHAHVQGYASGNIMEGTRTGAIGADISMEQLIELKRQISSLEHTSNKLGKAGTPLAGYATMLVGYMVWTEADFVDPYSPNDGMFGDEPW